MMTTMMTTRATFVGLALLTLAGCKQGEVQVRSPHWDKDGCARCRMAVSEPPSAAQLVTKGGVARYYDDLGCLVQDQASRSELTEATAYVLEPGSTTQWVRADAVRYVSGAKTPMGFGFMPEPDGKLTFAEVAATIRGPNRPKHGMH